MMYVDLGSRYLRRYHDLNVKLIFNFFFFVEMYNFRTGWVSNLKVKTYLVPDNLFTYVGIDTFARTILERSCPVNLFLYRTHHHRTRI